MDEMRKVMSELCAKIDPEDTKESNEAFADWVASQPVEFYRNGMSEGEVLVVMKAGWREGRESLLSELREIAKKERL